MLNKGKIKNDPKKDYKRTSKRKLKNVKKEYIKTRMKKKRDESIKKNS